MSTVIECDEGFVTSTGCHHFSNPQIKKSTIDSIQHTKEENLEKVDQNYCVKCDEQKFKINNLSDENSRLKELNKEMSEINRRRQIYDHERQDYIQRLLKTIKKLQLRSSRLVTSDSRNDILPLTERQRDLHIHSNGLQSEEKQHNEKSLLQQSYENALKENVNLQKELDELRNNFDTLIEQLSKIESEHIQALEFQDKLHKEDYEAEKKEKENALIKVKHLNSENDRLRKICTNYEKKLLIFVDLFQNNHLLNKKDLKHSSSQTRITSINGEQNKTNSLPNGYRFKANKSIEIQNSETDCNLSTEKCKIEDFKEMIE